MSDIASSRLSQSTTNNSMIKRHSQNSSQNNIITNLFTENDNPKNEYEDYILTKREKNNNLNKIQILRNRINNLKQQEQKNIRQIEILQEKEEKMKKIKNEKKDNKKKYEEYKKTEKEKFILIKKKIQEERQNQIDNLNNSLLKRKENLIKKKQILKQNKNEIKNKINKNNNTILNINKLKYEKAKTSLIFNKDKSKITKAEKEDEKRRNRLEIINEEKKENIYLEKNIELLEKEEEKYIDLIKQTLLIKKKLNDNFFHSNLMSKSFINKSNDNKYIQDTNINKRKLIRLQTGEMQKTPNNDGIRTLHKSIDINDYNNYNINSIINSNIKRNSCTNRNQKNNNISYENKNKDKNGKKIGLKQKILDKIVSIKLKSNLED